MHPEEARGFGEHNQFGGEENATTTTRILVVGPLRCGRFPSRFHQRLKIRTSIVFWLVHHKQECRKSHKGTQGHKAYQLSPAANLIWC
jgi:hypothetical protein